MSAVLGEDIPKVELLNQFAIIRIPESRIEELSRNPQIEFVEKPKRLFFAVNQGRSASCMTAVQSEFSPLGEPLTGEGVLVACIDSGIDYSHPDFAILTEVAEYYVCGTRPYRAIRQRDIFWEQSIQKSRLMRH